MSNIRVTYSGLISLVTKFSSIITGLVFTLIVTRSLSPEEFGTWALIGSLIVYATIINPIISYWTTREIARDIESGKTSIISSAILSAVGMMIYIIVAVFVGSQTNVDQNILIFAIILIPVLFINQILEAINLGWKPHATSIGFIVFEIVKIPFALLLVYFMDWGLYGVILSTFFSYLLSIIVLTIYAKEKINGKFDINSLKKWIKLSWLPLYRKAPAIIYLSDAVIFAIITGSVTGVAYYAAAKTVGMLVSNTRSISTAVYPKLLSGGKEEYFQENLVRIFYFAFPISAFSIIFAEAILFALNPAYQIASFVVIALTFRSFLINLSKVSFAALLGIEDVDKNKNSTFRDYIKSNIFMFPTFQFIRDGIYIAILVIIFHLNENSKELDLVYIWAIIGMIMEIPLVIYAFSLIRKNFSLKIDIKSILKYFFSSVLSFGIVYILMEKFLEFQNKIAEFLPNVILFAILGIGMYVSITYIIDSRTRKLTKAILYELKKKRK
jgi:O-antigen/teichoic acid export membrane protein